MTKKIASTPRRTKTKLRQLRPLTDKLARLKKKKGPEGVLARRLMPKHGKLARYLLEVFVFGNNKLLAMHIEDGNCKRGEFKAWRKDFLKLGFIDFRPDISGRWNYHIGEQLEEYVRQEKAYQTLVTQEQFEDLQQSVNVNTTELEELKQRQRILEKNQDYLIKAVQALFHSMAEIQINKPPITIEKILEHESIKELTSSTTDMSKTKMNKILEDLIYSEFKLLQRNQNAQLN